MRIDHCTTVFKSYVSLHAQAQAFITADSQDDAWLCLDRSLHDYRSRRATGGM